MAHRVEASHIPLPNTNAQYKEYVHRIKFEIMDSTKTNLLEKQPSSEFPKPNTLKIYVLSSVILLSLVTAGLLFITTVINLRDSTSPGTVQIINLTPTPTPLQSIRAICSFVPYKPLCHTTLSSTNFSSHNSAENIIFRSFQLSVDHLFRLANISELRDCRVLLNNEMNVLNNTIATSQNLDAFRDEVNEYLDRFERMEKYQQACLEKLHESGSTAIHEVKSNVNKMRRHVSNSRAVLLNIDPIIDKLYGSLQVTDRNSIHSYAYFFHGVGYDYMIIFLSQYVFLLFILVLMLRL